MCLLATLPLVWVWVWRVCDNFTPFDQRFQRQSGLTSLHSLPLFFCFQKWHIILSTSCLTARP